MSKNFRKNTIIVVIIAIISITVVSVSYAYRNNKEEKFVQQEIAQSSQSIILSTADLAQKFSSDRSASSIAEYLSFVKEAGEQPNVAILSLSLPIDQGQWIETIKNSVVAQVDIGDLETSVYQRDVAKSQNWSADSMDSQKQPQLILVPFSNESDWESQVGESETKAHLNDLYKNLRLNYPNANIIFITAPAQSQKLNQNEDYQKTVKNMATFLKEQNINVIDWFSQLIEDQIIINSDQYNGSGNLNEEAIKKSLQVLEKRLESDTFNFTKGYRGDNQDSDQLRSESESISASQSILAESQAIESSRQASIAYEQEMSRQAASASLASQRMWEQQTTNQYQQSQVDPYQYQYSYSSESSTPSWNGTNRNTNGSGTQ